MSAELYFKKLQSRPFIQYPFNHLCLFNLVSFYISSECFLCLVATYRQYQVCRCAFQKLIGAKWPTASMRHDQWIFRPDIFDYLVASFMGYFDHPINTCKLCYFLDIIVKIWVAIYILHTLLQKKDKTANYPTAKFGLKRLYCNRKGAVHPSYFCYAWGK